MARRVFISFLGYSNYGYCKYQKENFISDNVRFIQTATLDYLQSLEKWNENDVAYFLLTKGAKERNWVDNGHSQVATRLKELGIKCIASTTERKTTYNSKGTKLSDFSFVKFREY